MRSTSSWHAAPERSGAGGHSSLVNDARGRDRGGEGDRGALAIVLHTHMPYVEGFGTWPFGEEWLWEAIASSYLPLLELLDAGAPLTLSLTPVLCDQLGAPGIGERFVRFVDEVRRHTHDEDVRGLRAGGHETLACELERSWRDYELALERFARRDGDLLGALSRHAQWTSSATHAVLPLLASDAGVRLQVRAGVDSHRARFGAGWRGGFWLPECAHAPWLEPALSEAGVRATCVELTDRLGLGAREHLQPLLSGAGVVLVPIDRATISLVWSNDGYPAHGSYRDYHHHTVHHHNPWANDGSAYDHARALELAREHAADFVARTRARLRRDGAGLPGGGLAVCALDTELLGHWWYEGVAWLSAVVDECAAQGLELVRLDDALARHQPAPLPARLACAAAGPRVSTWGEGEDLSTWSGPAVAEMAFAARAGELQVLRAGAGAGAAAVRELLALQASDWAFMVSRELAVPYARERFAGHRDALARALAGGETAADSGLRELAAHADRALLLAP
ncbi:MAG TPA: 1,4-alpha-glucan branching protein domain-containing protein [Solirubrobacteraceae bacterium]|nr:1,4-alpha-glucan branching protein domain-containing protein [Solirubrobacteraceae bacterium]